MERIISLLFRGGRFLPFYLFTFLLLSCGGKREGFLLEGTFKGFNEGELYIYGFDGTHRLDTVAVSKGRFRYDIPLEDSTTFVLVFPNFSELPIFGTKGATVKLDGDATHLRELKIKGLKENEELTAFRQKTSGQTPPEMAKSVAQFIKEHPTSPFAFYLMRKYFIQTPQPDYQTAIELIQAIKAANPGIKGMGDLIRRMKGLKALKVGGKLPSFTATDVNGKMVTSSDLNAKVNLIYVWANWNYESVGILRRLQNSQKKSGDALKIVSVCLDADAKKCQRTLDRDSIKWSTICDGRMWDSPVMENTGLSCVPDNIITDGQGKIIAFSLNNRDLFEKIESLTSKTP
jgi:hypothetical protein